MATLSTTVVVMARAPAVGRVKTRLRPVLSARGVAELARAMLLDTLETAAALPGARPVLAMDGDLRDRPGPADTPVWDQGDGDLGMRMERALRRGLERSDAAVVVGTDVARLDVDRLARARDSLLKHDAVLAPAEDGGFFLLGLRRCPPGLLASVRWSSPHALDDTVARLREHGFTIHLQEPGHDVDQPEDLRRLLDSIARTPGVVPRTAKALRALEDGGELFFPAPGLATPSIAVVVPTLNEAARIDGLLDDLERTPGLHDVVVSDGGSTDGTADRVAARPHVALVRGPRGRAAQLNRGAAACRADVLLFLHADVGLPREAAAQIWRVLATPDTVAGAFETWTVDDARGVAWAPLLHLADLRSRYSALPYGDQAPFVRRAVFDRIGGFPDQPLMEDLELSLRLRREGRIGRARGRVHVSGRRFLERPIYYTVLVNVFPLLYRLGVPPRRLARLYGDPR